jgi:lactoylglutathione lyase
MIIEHIPIWTEDIDKIKAYYEKYFGAKRSNLYVNETTGFKRYFLHFSSGARLELMFGPNVPTNLNDTVRQHPGLIHFAFEVNAADEVERKARELKDNGFAISRGPTITGDGYYELETLDPDADRLEVMY